MSEKRGPKRNIAFTKPPEPSFIKKMKEAIAYQEPDTVETKRQIADFEDDGIEREDEKPVVVVLSPDDVTEEELKAFTEKEEDANKKITFSKPVKKESEEHSSLEFSSKRKDLQRRMNSQKQETKKVKNSSLLSFDEEEDY